MCNAYSTCSLGQRTVSVLSLNPVSTDTTGGLHARCYVPSGVVVGCAR